MPRLIEIEIIKPNDTGCPSLLGDIRSRYVIAIYFQGEMYLCSFDTKLTSVGDYVKTNAGIKYYLIKKLDAIYFNTGKIVCEGIKEINDKKFLARLDEKVDEIGRGSVSHD